MSGYDVQSTFSIVDNMTPVLGKVISSMTGVLDSIDMVNASSQNLFDVGSIKASRVAIEEAKASLEQIKPPTDENTDSQEKHNKKLREGQGFADGLLGKVKAMVVTYGGMKGIQKVFDMSDVLAQSTARLNLVKDTTMSIADAQGMVYKSAMRARQPYQQQLDMVTKLQLQAKNAFGSTAETVAFAEQLGKRFKIAGTDAQGIESVMYNLTQAMSTGVLRGQDLNSVLANAPSIVQDTAKYLGYTEDQVRKLAEEGKLSAQAVKNAMLSTANETNKAFSEIPLTFSDIATMGANVLTMKLQPALESLNKTFNTEEFQRSVTIVTDMIGGAAHIFAGFVDIGVQGFSLLADNIGLIVPPLGVAVGLFTLYNGIAIASAVADGIKIASTAIMEKGLIGAATAQWGLNAAMMANPIFWVVAGVMAFVGAIALGVGIVNKWKGTTYSAVGVVAGVFATAGAFIANTFIGTFNLASGVLTEFINHGITIAEFFANIFNDPLGAILKAFTNTFDAVLGIVSSVVGAVDTVLGTDMSSAVDGFRGKMNAWADTKVSEDYVHLDRLEPYKFERLDYSDTYDSAYNWGKEKQDSFGSWKDNLFSPGQYEDQGIKDMMDAIDNSGLAGDVKDGKKQKDKELDISNSQLEFIRSIAERRNLEQLTVGEVNVKYENQFGDVHERADLDGFWEGVMSETSDAVKYGIGGVINSEI